MNMTALDMAKQAINFNEIDQSKIPNFIYRTITSEDLDMIYSFHEVNEALVPLRGDREDIEILLEHESRVAVNLDSGEMVFCLGQHWSRAEISTRYLYFYQGKFCTLIDTQEGWNMSIFYKSMGMNLDAVKEFLIKSLIYAGEFFIGEDYVVQNWQCNFIESKDLFNCYV